MDELTDREKDLLAMLFDFAVNFSAYLNGINASEITEISNLENKICLYED